MRYVKLYREFVEVDQDIEISDKTIKDVLSDDFFDDYKDTGSYIDSKGVIHIKNWKIY